MPNYELVVMFDDRNASEDKKRDYAKFVEKYNAIGFGDIITGQSKIYFNSRKDLLKDVLREELKSVKLVKLSKK